MRLVRANSALRASLAIYHLISNAAHGIVAKYQYLTWANGVICLLNYSWDIFGSRVAATSNNYFQRCGSSCVSTTKVQESDLNKWNRIQATSFTPRCISVSSEHVLSRFDDGNRVTFPITPAVKGTSSPAVSGGAVTQDPLRVQSNSRRQELIEVKLTKCITSYYNWSLPQIWKKVENLAKWTR